MNEKERLVARKTARIMRAARKRNGLAQVEIAKILSTSQANISKLENGALIPSAHEWFEFCSATGISPDSLNAGYLDRGEPTALRSERMESGFTLPSRYAENRGSKVRALNPLLKFFASIHGEERLDAFFTDCKLDPDLFIDLNNQISLNFLLDLSRKLIQEGSLKPELLDRLFDTIREPHTHGVLHCAYDGIERSSALIQLLISKATFYEVNFHYALEDVKASQMVLSIRPEPHLKELKYRNDSDLGDFLCRYKKRYFSAFTGYGGSAAAALEETECHYRGAERCIYRLTLSS